MKPSRRASVSLVKKRLLDDLLKKGNQICFRNLDVLMNAQYHRKWCSSLMSALFVTAPLVGVRGGVD